MLKYSVLSLIVITVLLGQQSNIVNAQCESNPCQNGGVCNQDAALGLYWCTNCPSGCNGQNCECTQNTLCASNPCQNGGVCNQDADLGLYWCNCQSNCSGQNCESCTINACSSRPCKNGGACTPVGSIYQCSCRTGCYGSDCSVCYTTATTTTTTQTPACSSSPCKNGGTCVSAGSSYQCYCPSNCYGYDCSYCSGTTAAPCADYNPTVCRNYAALGYCNLNAYINGALFRVSCPVSCNNCATTKATTTTKASCVDTQANCVYWANYCNLIPYPNPCPKTCKLC